MAFRLSGTSFKVSVIVTFVVKSTDKPELLTDPETGEVKKVHIFATILGVSSLIYAEAFMEEKLPQFIDGTVHAVEFYGGVTKYFVPDNL